MSKPIQEAPAKETDNNFEASVLAAAKAQAERIVRQAKKDADAMLDTLLAKQQTDPVAAHKTQLAAEARRQEAAAKQENLKHLLVYRRQLVNGLFAEASEELQEFTQSDAYAAFLCGTLGAYADKAEKGSVVLLRKDDMKHKAAIAKVLPKAEFEADDTIQLGGGKLRTGHVLYDETLDDRVLAQRTAFLERCNLHVSAKELEQANEQ